jgi:hypothetical protein
MNKDEAVKIIVLLLNRATLNSAEVFAANEAIKALQADPAPKEVKQD